MQQKATVTYRIAGQAKVEHYDTNAQAHARYIQLRNAGFEASRSWSQEAKA